MIRPMYECSYRQRCWCTKQWVLPLSPVIIIITNDIRHHCSHTRTVQSYWPGGANLPLVTHASFGPTRVSRVSITQTTSRWVQPFLHSSRERVVDHVGYALPPQNHPSPRGGSGPPPSNSGSLVPLDLVSQTASPSVQPLLHSSPQYPYTL